MLTPEAKETLTYELVNWLLSYPERDDILYYIRRASDEVKLIVLESSQLAARSAMSTFIRNTHSLGFSGLKTLPTSEKLDLIRNLVRYNTSSVISSLAKKFSGISAPDPVPALYDQALQAAKAWDSAVVAAGSIGFIEVDTYVHSLIRVIPSNEKVTELRRTCLQLFEQASTKAQEGDENYAAGQDCETFLKGLNIFPIEYASSMAKAGVLPDLILLLDRLHRALLVIEAMGLEQARSGPLLVDENVWEWVTDEAEDKLIVAFTVEEVADTPASQAMLQFYEFCLSLCVRDKIMSGEFRNNVIQYISKLTAGDQKAYVEAFRDFLYSSDTVSDMLDPFDSYSIISKLYQVALTVQAEAEIATFVDEYFENDRPFIQALLASIVSIFKLNALRS
jgi:hypothetical protein